MYSLKTVTQFAAAHQLRGYQGGCENLHGHNWTVEVHVAGDKLNEDGLLIDFREVKAATNKVLDELDHAFLNDLAAFREQNPSSENIARHVFEAVSSLLESRKIRVIKVTAWESDSACASYSEP